MYSVKAPHLSDEQLARFQDGELSARESGHLRSCPICAERLRDMEAAAAVYIEYRDTIRGPVLAPAPQSWAGLNSLVAEAGARRTVKPFRWWPAVAIAAALGALVMALLLRRPSESAASATELLSQSARTAFPMSRRISLRVHGRTLFRPAVLISDSSLDSDADWKRLRGLFVQARYSWSDPLSARSFQAWRRDLPEKRDSVTVAHDRANDVTYRVRTETSSGNLHAASLTLSGPDLRPTAGAFEFAGEVPLEMQETTASAPVPPPATASPGVAETPATPADMLRVFAALDDIGADAGDPIEVSEDTGNRHIIVRSNGLNPERQEEIAKALRPLPRVILDFNAALSMPPSHAQRSPSEKLANGIPAALRERFETRAGGVIAFQEMTDRVLEASATVVARAHALQTLAEKFPPDVEARLDSSGRELLLRLRQRHISEIERLEARIRTEMKPLLGPSDDAQQTQSETAAFWDSARDVDNTLNRLLAGSYSEATGEEMLHSLPSQLNRLESAIRMQQEKK
ncbi:MAG TPA: hypothetical protein VKU01_02365 [Bryobacteraceae bacterium]|nr:hypothetical protein [Bryobacteraceae bacterium]